MMYFYALAQVLIMVSSRHSYSSLTFDGASIILPTFDSDDTSNLFASIKIHRNKLVDKRILDRTKERVSRVKLHPHHVAVAISRLSGQPQVAIVNPSTPPQDESSRDRSSDSLALTGIKKRMKPTTGNLASPYQPISSHGGSRLNSLKVL